jgi:hypothetical protein
VGRTGMATDVSWRNRASRRLQARFRLGRYFPRCEQYLLRPIAAQADRHGVSAVAVGLNLRAIPSRHACGASAFRSFDHEP